MSVIKGQLVQYCTDSYAKFGVALDIYDDRYIMILVDGTYQTVITDNEALEELKSVGVVNTSVRSCPLFRDGKPVMSGTKKVGLFKKRTVYTFEPAE